MPQRLPNAPKYFQMLQNTSGCSQLLSKAPKCTQMHPNAWIHLKWPSTRKNLIGGGLVDSVFCGCLPNLPYLNTSLPYHMGYTAWCLLLRKGAQKMKMVHPLLHLSATFFRTLRPFTNVRPTSATKLFFPLFQQVSLTYPWLYRLPK